jgi:cysteinyl-tRNA synthetase
VLLSSHYRASADWTDKKVREATDALRKWGEMTDGVEAAEPTDALLAAVADDLNTPLALTEMHRMAKAGEVANLAGAMALLNLHAPETVAVDGADIVEAALIARSEARAAKDFARADALRDALAAADVVVMDKPGEATQWRPGPAFDASKLEGAV